MVNEENKKPKPEIPNLEENRKKAKPEVTNSRDDDEISSRKKIKCQRMPSKFSFLLRSDSEVKPSPTSRSLKKKNYYYLRNLKIKPSPVGGVGDFRLIHEEYLENLRCNQQCIFLLPLPKHSILLGAFYDEEKGESEIIQWVVKLSPQNRKCKVRLGQILETKPWIVDGKIVEVSLIVKDVTSMLLISSNDYKSRNFHVSMIPILPTCSSITTPVSSSVSANICAKYDDKVDFEKSDFRCGWLNSIGMYGIKDGAIDYGIDSVNLSQETISIPGQSILGVNCDLRGNVLYLSTNKGNIYGYDLRCNLEKSTFQMFIGVSVYQIEPLRNDQIIASGFNNFLCKLDLRDQKIVVEYPYHDNLSMKIKACVDERQNILCSAGESGCVRLWNLKTGKLLRRIAPPKNYERNDFASTLYSSELCTPALITVSQGVVSFYR